MTEQRDLVDHMSRAARTSLFDAVCNPDLMIGIVLSNLMSPALWEFRKRIEEKTSDTSSRDHQHAIMEELAHYVNGHFFHVLPQAVGDIWGLVEIEAEAASERRGPVLHAINLMVQHVNMRLAAPGSDERIDLKPYVSRGLFPEYLYATLDVVHANRRILKHKKHKPYGITCCADEAILITSLACVLDGVTADDIVIVGSPEHYTTFIRHDGHGFWFNGKNEFFDAESWAQEVETNADGDPQIAFDHRLMSLDRVITPHGTFFFHDRHSTIAPERWQQIRANLAQFFGVELRQIAEACSQDLDISPHPLGNLSFAGIDRLQSADEAMEVLKELASSHPGSAFEAAFYAFRYLDVRHPEAYVAAAVRGHRTREAAADLTDIDEALEIVRSIEGNDPPLGDRNRLTLADEVLLLNTGGDRDKALLLYALLHHAQTSQAAPELILTETDSYVRSGDRLTSLRSFETRQTVDGYILFRHS